MIPPTNDRKILEFMFSLSTVEQIRINLIIIDGRKPIHNSLNPIWTEVGGDGGGVGVKSLHCFFVLG